MTQALNSNSLTSRNQLFGLYLICVVLQQFPRIHSNLNSGPNMVLQQAGYISLFSYKVSNATLRPNQIAPREISDIIWYTFLTSLDCGCAELWNNKSVIWREIHLSQRKSPHARRAVTGLFTKEEILLGRIVQCLQRRKGRNEAIIEIERKTYFENTLNGFPPNVFLSFFFFGGVNKAILFVFRCN